MQQICFGERDHHWFRQWLGVYLEPSHYLNQHWITVNWTPKNKLQWNLNQIQSCHWRKCLLRNGGHFVQGRWVMAAPYLHGWWFLIKNIWSSHWKGKFYYTTQYEGPLSQYGFSNSHCCTKLCHVIVKFYVQIYPSHIPHPYDRDNCTKNNVRLLRCFNFYTVLYHTFVCM